MSASAFSISRQVAQSCLTTAMKPVKSLGNTDFFFALPQPLVNCNACSPFAHPVGKTPDSIYPKVIISSGHCEANALKLSDIFKEGSEARKLFGKFYAVAAIVIILAVLMLLALATRGV